MPNFFIQFLNAIKKSIVNKQQISLNYRNKSMSRFCEELVLLKRELAYYEIFPKILESGKNTKLAVRPLGKHAEFIPDTEYLVMFLPMCETNESLNTEYDSIVVHSRDGLLQFEHAFPGEQAHIVRVFKLPVKDREMDRLLGNFMVYSLLPDLFVLRPYRGDFHVHTCRSDGKEAPAVVAANYRKSGFDFLAITDHHVWYPSEEAIKAYEGTPIDLSLFNGEEVHPHKNHVHMVNFGGKYSVNELFENDPDSYYREVNEIMERIKVPEGVNAFQYASCVWCFDRIREAGGLGIFCHPYWIANVYHVAEKFTDFLFEKKPFDAFELLGGHEVYSNNMQTAYHNEARAKGMQIPVVGASDSHGTENAMWFNWMYTIVFSKDMELASIKDAVKDLKSVAVEHYPGEAFRIYGPFRLVKYADFLLNEYFPLHDQLCFEEGRLMKDYICGDKNSLELLKQMQGRTKVLLERCFNI